jgi:hypothetical protein
MRNVSIAMTIGDNYQECNPRISNLAELALLAEFGDIPARLIGRSPCQHAFVILYIRTLPWSVL